MLFWAFTIFYLVACPLIILYALGYSYAPGAASPLIKTGLISVATDPPGASIDLDLRRLPEKTPALIRGLRPGGYTLVLSLAGHRSWAGRVDVEPEKATSLEKILLLPSPPEVREADPRPFRQLHPIDGTPYFLAFSGPLLRDIVAFDRKTETSRSLFPEGSPFASLKLQRLVTADGSGYVFVVARGEKPAYLWARLGKETDVRDVSNLFRDEPKDAAWDPERPEEIFFHEGDALSRANPETAALYPKYYPDARGFGFSDGKIVTLGFDGSLTRSAPDGSRESLASEDSLPPALLDQAGKRFRVEPLSKEDFLLLDERGALFLNCFPYKIAEGVLGVKADRGAHEALFWTSEGVGILDFSEAAQDEGRATKPRWIVRGGKKITQASWVHGRSHVLFADRDRAYLVEVTGAARPRVTDLFEMKKGTRAAWIEADGSAFYLDRQGSLRAMRLAPRSAMLPMASREEASS